MHVSLSYSCCSLKLRVPERANTFVLTERKVCEVENIAIFDTHPFKSVGSMDDRGGGRGWHRGGVRHNHRYRGRGRGRGRGHRHQPYNNNRSRYNSNHGGRGRGRPGNRFGAGSFAQQDPQTAMLRQVFSFVSRVGEFNDITQFDPSTEAQNVFKLRPVEANTARNIKDLVNVLCSEDKLDILFKYQPASVPGIKSEETIGNLGHLVISCASSLPLQTTCYAALTLALSDKTKGCRWEGFASRCVAYAVHNFITDLDKILRTGENVSRAACRMKLLLRYLAIMGKIGVVKGHEEGCGGTLDSDKLTVFGLLSVLVNAAKLSKERKVPTAAIYLLISLALSTLPYVVEYVPQEAITEAILEPIEILLQSYKSTFTPGTGCTSLLLKVGQDEEEDSSDDDDDDDDDDNDDSDQICDSLQDLLRVSKNLRNDSRFALPLDSPWKGLVQPNIPGEGIDGAEMQTHPVTFSDREIYLSVKECDLFRYLLEKVELNFAPFSLDGLVFGRLPIFGSPPDPDDDELDDIDETVVKNEELKAFQNNFGLLDRFFVADILRDCLISHETFVNETGLQLGNPKSVAEELLSVYHLFSGENPSQGIAYAVVETVLGLIVQSRDQCSLRHTYLSRVLLELTRLRPLLISPALAVAMRNLFEDYLPALVPEARDNISRWFAFHLTNTDYQWPSAYWQLWEPYALSTKISSRGRFVRRSIEVMMETIADPSLITNTCLASVKSLAKKCLPQPKNSKILYAEGDALEKFETGIEKLLWDQHESPARVEDYLLGNELDNLLVSGKGRWLRTIALARVIVTPLKFIHQNFKDAFPRTDEDGMDQITDDTQESKDYYVSVTDTIEKYGKVFVNVLNKEAEFHGDVTEGGALALHHVGEIANFNSSLFQGLIACFLENSVFDGTMVARWALGDLGETMTGCIVPEWWEFASSGLERSNDSGKEGMILDGDAAEVSATSARQKVLTYIVSRVCSLLENNEQKRLDPVHVNLIEGMKSVAVRAKRLNDSDTRSLRLAHLCCGSSNDSITIDLLKNCLIQL